MNGFLSVATIAVSLTLAVWYLVLAVLNRAPGRAALYSVLVLAVLAAAVTVAALIWLAEGNRPTETAVFVGYLITFFAVPPTGFQLARMEPTRWGSVILTVACLTVPALVLRLQQIAAG